MFFKSINAQNVEDLTLILFFKMQIIYMAYTGPIFAEYISNILSIIGWFNIMCSSYGLDKLDLYVTFF